MNKAKTKNKEKDPVCGMEVGEHNRKYVKDFEGTKYHFCSQECKDKFESNPSAFARERVA